MKKTLISGMPKWAWATLLLAIVCLPRVTIDAYLPAWPSMAVSLGVSHAQLQMTLTAYMGGYAFSMLVCGPLADHYGRKTVLLWGMLLYLAATLVCVVTQRIEALVIARVCQAVGGCCGTVVGRVIVRDLFDRRDQANILGHISTGMALSPVLAPIVGSFISTGPGWRWIFALLGATACLLLLIIVFVLPETRPAALRASAERVHLMRSYGALLADRYFLRYTLAISFFYCTYFPFVVESSGWMQGSLGMTPREYALVFALVALGYVAGAQIFRVLSGRIAVESTMRVAIACNGVGVIALVAAVLWPQPTMGAVVAAMWLVMISVGFAIPACQFAVLQPFGQRAGMASGLFFFVQMAIAAGCSALTSILSDGSARPIGYMAAASSVALMLAWVALRPLASNRRVVEPRC